MRYSTVRGVDLLRLASECVGHGRIFQKNVDLPPEEGKNCRTEVIQKEMWIYLKDFVVDKL